MKYAFAAALLAASLAGFDPSAALADDDYAFEATTAKVVANQEAVVAVRLVNKSTGKPVPNAVIFQTRLDMSPDSMGEMIGAVTPLPATEPGVYRFGVKVGMAGRWALKMAAKVPGESETVRGDVTVTAAQ
jgi:hypothetical protein